MVDAPHLVSDFSDHIEYELKCPICKENIKIVVQKNFLDNKNVRYPFDYLDIHGNPPHGITLYIDKNWSVRGMDIIKNVVVATPESDKSEKLKIIPEKIGKISPMAQQLGIISKKEYKVLEKIDGKLTIEEISSKLKESSEEITHILQKLIEKNMVKLNN